MILKYGRIVCILSILVIFLSCQTLDDSEKAREAPRSGFVKEMDEPASRGRLKRISPEQIDVLGRFAISSDGNWIVYSGRQKKAEVVFARDISNYGFAEKKQICDLWLIPSNGGAPKKLTSGNAYDSWSPSFTMDGNYIVFESQGQLWKMRADGSGGRQKLPGSGVGIDMWPHVSSKDRIVFCSLEENLRFFIWTCTTIGSDLTQLREGQNPIWSPDGTLIAFGYIGDIWLISSDGRDLYQLTTTNDIFEGLPTFSPDGTKIAYVSNESPQGKRGGDFNVWHMNIDGTEKIQITELEAWDSWPVWGPNGLYFLSGRASGKEKFQKIWFLESQ